MDRTDIKALLRPVGINVVYGWYEQGHMPKTPYIVINYLSSADVAADNQNYVKRDRWQVDLVTAKRDEQLETKVETALRNGGLFYSKTQIADSSDAYIAIHYRFMTIGG